MDDKNFDLIPVEQFNSEMSVNASRPGLQMTPTGQGYTGPAPQELQQNKQPSKLSLALKMRNEIDRDPLFTPAPVNKLADLINNSAKYFRLPKVAGGALQGTYDTAKSAADLIPGVNVPSINLSKYGTQDPISDLAFQGGKLIPEIAAYTEGYGALSKIPKIGSASLLATSGRGAATGFVLGENAPGGRKTGAAAGAIGAPFYELQPKAIADRVIARKSEMIQKYKGLYGGFFDNLKSKGLEKIDKVSPQSFNVESMLKAPGVSSKDFGSLGKYFENPTFENAHAAQSDLGKLSRSISIKTSGRSLSSEENEGLKNIITADKKINGQALMQLGKKGQGDLAQKYQEIGQGYREDVVPYLNKTIRDYERGDITPSYLVKSLPNKAKFQKTADIFHQDLMRYGRFKGLANNLQTGVGYGVVNNLLSRIGLNKTKDEYLGTEDSQ